LATLGQKLERRCGTAYQSVPSVAGTQTPVVITKDNPQITVATNRNHLAVLTKQNPTVQA